VDILTYILKIQEYNFDLSAANIKEEYHSDMLELLKSVSADACCGILYVYVTVSSSFLQNKIVSLSV
jgi:hypothetical protein